MIEAIVLWRRLDMEGHDCCRLIRETGGWTIDGVSNFLDQTGPASLHYRVNCDSGWTVNEATVRGFAGTMAVDLTIDRSQSGAWQLNGKEQHLSAAILDLDLAFTPATNILPLRRMDIAIGDTKAAPAAYLPFPDVGRLETLEQSYRRITERIYAYEAPRFGYQANLSVADSGFVLEYPGLWQSMGHLSE
jgi:hypothetical protein